MGVAEGGMAAASFSLLMAMLQKSLERGTATRQETVDLFDAALVIMEASAEVFPKGVQESARRILAEMQDAFAKAGK